MRDFATYTKIITKADAIIDWRLPAVQIERMTRAYDPWPVARTTFGGSDLMIYRARVIASEGDADAGTIVSIGANPIIDAARARSNCSRSRRLGASACARATGREVGVSRSATNWARDLANLKNESTGIAARKAALEILFRVNHKGAYADALLGDRLPEFELNDRRLVTLMVLGTIAWRAQLDFEIERLASRPLAKIDAAVLEILRLGLFQTAPSRSRSRSTPPSTPP